MTDTTSDNLPALRPSTLPAHASSFDLAPAAWSLAQKIASTEFVPKGLRNEPEKVLAAMLTGNELGIGPMQALAKIHVIDGKPGAAAELMRALILRDGHEFWIEESSNTRCTVGIKRRGSTRDQKFTWTLDDAKAAGLAGKDVWKKYPRAMLLARATSEGARAVCPDTIAGMSYTIEELTDGDYVEVSEVSSGAAVAAAAPGPEKRTARATRTATRSSAAAPVPRQPAPPIEREQPPLPGEEEDDDEITDAEIVDDKGAAGPQPAGEKQQGNQDRDLATGGHSADDVDTPDDDGPAPKMATREQVTKLQVVSSAIGLRTKAQRLEWAAGHIGHDIGSYNDLTFGEVSQLIDLAEQEIGPEGEGDAA